jgi:hypothetical protein
MHQKVWIFGTPSPALQKMVAIHPIGVCMVVILAKCVGVSPKDFWCEHVSRHRLSFYQISARSTSNMAARRPSWKTN